MRHWGIADLAGVLAAVLLAGGCGPSGQAPGDRLPAMQQKPMMLPAWKMPGDYKIPGKADQYDDYRAQHPELYAATQPPNMPGFRSFVEWEEMQSVLLSYPGGLTGSVGNSLGGMVKAAVDVSHFYVLVPNTSAKNEFISVIKALGVSQSKIDAKVHFITHNSDSIWMIDFAPVPIVAPDQSIAFVDFRYYHERVYDDAFPTVAANLWGLTAYRPQMDYEGGNYQADDLGTCYHSQGTYWENADKTEEQVNQILNDFLGCKQHVVLVPLEDGTTHMDMFSKLVSRNVFVLGKGTSTNNTGTTINTLEKDFQILQAVTLADGSKLTIHRIPMPYQKDGVWRTYTNSTFVNKINMVPVYKDYSGPQADAMAAWKTAMPDWTHVGIESGEVITWGGAMHCTSRTIPVGTFKKWIADGTCSGGTCAGPADGYDGACEASSDCVGPKWVCNLPDCGGSTPADCGNITFEGCCDGTMLKYCEDGVLKQQNCGSSGCGWNKQNDFYDCNQTGADPSGHYPRACGGCTPDCTQKTCGSDGCGGSCGTCPAGKACQAGLCVACTPNCSGKQCGDDGCGGSCGTCPASQVCNAGKCETPTDPCKGITFEGCCDGKLLKYCENDQIKQQQCQQSCGWDKTNGFYDCGFSGADPSGQHPIACAGCTPNCSGKVCGDDGCGGSCGSCPAGKSCQAGQCVSCTPNCTGKQCGDDGCGGSCGTCLASQVCNAGKCETQTDPCKGILYEGCCDGATLYYCEDNQLKTLDCGQNEPPNNTCGWNAAPDANYYDCGQTGADPSGKFPLECKPACQPNCSGKQCGPDGCGGSCGSCPAGSQCSAAGKCEPTSGCGDVTEKGVCEGTKLSLCVENKVVTTDCAVQAGFICGYSDELGKYQCMEKATCKPDCAGKTCGPDGCDGSCGTCKADETCQENICVPSGAEPVPDTPDAVTHPDVSPFEIPVQTDSAGPDGACVPNCSGRACGDDGCGGSCGTCKPGFGCTEDGVCVGLPKPDSGAKEDVASSDDVPGPTTGTEGKSGGGGCAAGSGSVSIGFGLLVAALGLMAFGRRREG